MLKLYKNLLFKMNKYSIRGLYSMNYAPQMIK